MTVVGRKGSLGRKDGPGDQFPVGMRVLAVDDDPTCLKLLETLLIHCQYHVTTTSQAITALQMLRENKDQFDLVISDVHMPDMDGFKLLEHVGLEMDLPVIMLSANGETQTVMKGITHGACDYLLKPVRIEELRNIWQHVLRRRKCDTRDGNNFDNGEDSEKAQIAFSEVGQGSASNGESDRNLKLNKKRKDQNEEDEDDSDENEDSANQKKPRVVWSVDLHRKFVAAVNQLGIDKAVPKKILDLMNVEGLTRENVASHLQKYRLYLKRLSAVASQANMAAAFGARNPSYPSYLPMGGSLDRFRNFHSSVGSRQLPALTPLQPNGVAGRMNSPAGFGQQRPVPSGTVQHGHIHNTSNHINDPRKQQGIGVHGNLLQGIPMSLEVNNCFPGGFSGGGLPIGNSSNSFGLLGSYSDVRSLASDPFKIGLRDSSHLPDLGRCNDTWQAAVPSSNFSANNSLAANVSPIISHMDINRHEVSSSSVAVAPLHDRVVGNDVQHQASSLGGSIMRMLTGGDENSNFLSNSAQKLDKQKQTHARNSNLIFNRNSSIPILHGNDSIADSPTLNNGFPNERLDSSQTGQNSGAPFLQQNGKSDFQLSYTEDFILETTKLHGGFSSNTCSFDDLVNAIAKPVHRDDVNFFDGDMAGDIYSLGTCM